MKWADYLRSRTPHGKELVEISMDETRLGYAFHGAAGNIVKPRYFPHRRMPPVTNVLQSDARGAVTYVSFLTSHAMLQRELPQILLGKAVRFPFRTMLQLGRIPRTVKLITTEKGWNTADTMLEILNLLHESLVGFPNLQVVLIVDCAKCHLSLRVLERVRTLGLWLMFVPAGLTYLLQPLDFYVFHRLKAFLRSEFREALIAQGFVSIFDWFRVIFKAMTDFMVSQDWAPAFDFLGLRGSRATLCDTLVSLCPQLVEQGPPVILQREEVARIVPRGVDVPYWLLFAAPRGVRRRLLLR